MKRIIVLILVSLLILTGCTSPRSSDSSINTASGVYKKDPNLNELGEFPICKEPITLKIMRVQDANVQDFKTNRYTRKIEEYGNVNLEFELVPRGDIQTKLNLIMNSGIDDLPDIILHSLNQQQIASFSESGMIIPLNKYYENSSYYLKKQFEKVADKDILKYMTMPDKNIYSIPRYNESLHNELSRVLWIYKPWIELGGDMDSIHDTEEIRDELLKIAFGVWDHIKNQDDHGADNWELEWVGFLPGKRESLRYVGDYILTQNDIENGGKNFEDTVAYGGWQIDDHLPGGFKLSGKDGGHLRKRRLSEPYSIPYRCLYSKNIENLVFAGRNISATHVAFSSTRVMGTIGVMGQAVGTAVSIAVKNNITPRKVGENHIKELQSLLLEDDCFLPGFKREPYELSKQAALTAEYGDPLVLRNGIDRRIWGNDNGYYGKKAITYSFDEKKKVSGFRLVVDSDLDREFIEGNPNLMHIPMPLFRSKAYNNTSFGFPKCMLKSFRIEALDDSGNWAAVYETNDNYQRLIRGKLDVTTKAIRLVPLSTYASEALDYTYDSAVVHIFSFDIF